MNKTIKNAAALLLLSACTTTFLSSCKDEIKSCETGYEGSDCKTLTRSKFIGQWKGSEQCNTDEQDYTISITTNNSNNLTINYSNINNKSFVATGKVTSANELHLDGSATGTGGGKITFSGSAVLDETEGTITVNYLISSDIENTGCTFKGKKI
ncbi:hypothetical protein F0919_01480 [Taibaiella lutea]|uniref:Lipocalin-like domain-containing protein n=1 Tax=Taibaiella lutea TaxID=2608001 RepID=A0A5M6CMX9_9BACT|nr:hypothetical protein [Taibaiella lutea]KAA5536366.1 hypothetical protein F0919_01480 [Taibaiella lutea]